jgi:hypothetical protein
VFLVRQGFQSSQLAFWSALVLIGFVSWLRFLFVVGCRFWLFDVMAGSVFAIAQK